MVIRQNLQNLLNEANEMRTHNLTKSLDIVEKVLISCNTPNLNDLKAKALSQISLYSMIVGNNDESLKYAQESIQLFEKLNDEKGIADAKFSIASVYYKTDNYHIGLVFLIDALNIYKKFNDFYNISRCEKSLGTVYEYSGDQKLAIQSYENAIDAAKLIKNLNLESNAYNNLSGVYIKQGKIDLASKIINKSITLKKQTGDTRGLAFAIYGSAKVNFVQKKYKEAEIDFLESIKIHSEMGERVGLAMSNHKLAQMYFELKQIDKALNVLGIALKISNEFNITLIKFKSYYLFYSIFKLQNDMETALEYLELYIKEKEKVVNTQTLRVIESYDMLVQMKTIQKEVEFQKEKALIIEKSDKIQASAKVRQEFLSTMSHEIRTPLNAITTIISLLSKNSNADDLKLIDSLKFSSDLLILIINDILDYSKLDLGKMKLELTPNQLLKLINNIWSTYRLQAKEKGLDFILKTNVSDANIYCLDAMKLTQILVNLINNAIKFTENGAIVLTVTIVKKTVTSDILEFKIKDSGVGIEKENLHKIFESFSQINNPITRKTGGTGLGLAIVKYLVKLHKSNIRIASNYGVGSEFTFKLKLKRSNEVIEKNEIIISKQLSGKKILLVEDNKINALIASKLLSQWGIETKHAENGIIAVSKSQNEKFDCILMDIHMPEMDGFEASKIIKTTENINITTPIYGLSADVFSKNNQLYSAYFADFLFKPLEIEKLHAALINAINVH